MGDLQHSIKVAARRSGLTPHVIRVWEKRYRAIEPARTGTNRRLYSEGEIERLTLLRHATQAGHTISNVANLPVDQLRSIVSESVEHAAPERRAGPRQPNAPGRLRDQCLEAIRRLDAQALEEVLTQGTLALGSQGLLREVIAPLTQSIGELWREGTLSAAHEHFASAVIRVFLANVARPFAGSDGAPVLVVTTPSGQLHELGAVIVGAAAGSTGWRVTYLGASLPALEIAGAAVQNKARAVALSIVYPEDDPNLPAELLNLRRVLPAGVKLLVGGRAAPAYRETLDQIRALGAADLNELYKLLDELRASRRDGGG